MKTGQQCPNLNCLGGSSDVKTKGEKRPKRRFGSQEPEQLREMPGTFPGKAARRENGFMHVMLGCLIRNEKQIPGNTGPESDDWLHLGDRKRRGNT